MELRDYIEKGIRAKTSAKELAAYIGIAPQSLTDAKAHRRGIPNVSAVKLANLIGADPLAVIAASELATERQEEKREFWFPFANHKNLAKTAGIALIFSVVTNFVTPSPAEAAPRLESHAHGICIMLNFGKTLRASSRCGNLWSGRPGSPISR